MLPSQTFVAQPDGAINAEGVELDGSDDVIFNTQQGTLYADGPDGTALWTAPTGITGAAAGCTVSEPALSSDGAIYVGADNGYLYQVAPDGVPAGGAAPSAPIFTDPNSQGLAQTAQIGPDNTLYLNASHEIMRQ
jgi:outer membrane protein assembly factor BamB